MSFIDTIIQNADGAAIIGEWLGAGGLPVPQEQSVRRGRICLGCEENRAPRWWQKSKSKIAKAIRAHLEVKNKVNVSVPFEDRLHMCRACGCCIKLKIHTPIEHIENHTTAEQMRKLPEWCWVRRETYFSLP